MDVPPETPRETIRRATNVIAACKAYQAHFVRFLGSIKETANTPITESNINDVLEAVKSAIAFEFNYLEQINGSLDRP